MCLQVDRFYHGSLVQKALEGGSILYLADSTLSASSNRLISNFIVFNLQEGNLVSGERTIRMKNNIRIKNQ